MKLFLLLPFVGLAHAAALDAKANTSNVDATTAAGIDAAKLAHLNVDTQAKTASHEKSAFHGRGGDDYDDGCGRRGGRGYGDYWVNHRGSNNYKRADLAVVAKGHGHGYHRGRPAPHHGHHSHGHYKRDEKAKTNGTAAAKGGWGDDDCDSDDDDDDDDDYGYGRGHGGRGRNYRDWNDDDDEEEDWKANGETNKTQ